MLSVATIGTERGLQLRTSNVETNHGKLHETTTMCRN
jgi:hypothetical protein